MVKIVGRDESAVKRTTCRSCAAILEYTSSEVQSITSRDYSGVSDTDYYIICPNCGQRAYVRSY